MTLKINNILFCLQVKAYNNKGHSNFSDEISAITRVDRIPAPQRVTFDPESHVLSIYITATCLQLVSAQAKASVEF